MTQYLFLVVVLCCLVATGTLHALTPQDDREATVTQQTGAGKRSPPVKQSPRKPAKPATTFKPSERISADSAVSFPVDI